MSRTITHQPHDVCELPHQPGVFEWHDHRNDVCDLAAKRCLTPRQLIEANRHFSMCSCGWSLPWHQSLKCSDQSVPLDYRRLGWLKPARQRTRLQLHATTRQWNAGEDIDDDPAPYRHRHGGRYAWS